MGAKGFLAASELTTVQGSLQLATGTARAWKRLQAAAKSKLGRTIAIAKPAGAYRSAAVQNAMHTAGAGHDRTAKVRWGLNASSTVSIAAHPYGTHEDARRVDVVGTAMDSAFLRLAGQYGFKLEFPGRDPNHLVHDGKTATKPVTPAAVLPAKKQVVYKVKAGDTLSSIAKAYSDPRDDRADVDVDDLLRLNPGIVPTALKIGQKVRVA